MKGKKMISLVFVSLLFFQCEEEQKPHECIDQSKIDHYRACYDIFAPVCGCDGNTYSNDCYAQSAGVLSFTQGACSEKN
ncbi:MAG: Kazal-type serine protease inhibitor family protein [Bacteroidota bacterium]